MEQQYKTVEQQIAESEFITLLEKVSEEAANAGRKLIAMPPDERLQITLCIALNGLLELSELERRTAIVATGRLFEADPESMRILSLMIISNIRKQFCVVIKGLKNVNIF